MAIDLNNWASNGNSSIMSNLLGTGNDVKYIGEYDKLIATENGNAELYVNDTMAVLSNQNNGIQVSDQGVYIQGRVEFSADPASIRMGGHFVFNEELLTTLPSTLFNPIATLIYKDPPYARKAYLFLKTLTSFA